MAFEGAGGLLTGTSTAYTVVEINIAIRVVRC